MSNKGAKSIKLKSRLRGARPGYEKLVAEVQPEEVQLEEVEIEEEEAEEAEQAADEEPEEIRAAKKRLAEREKSISAREKKLQNNGNELQEKESKLQQREKELNDKEEDIERKLERLSKLISSVEEEKKEVLKASEEEIVSFILTIVDKVLQSEIENGRYKIDQIIKSTLRELKTESAMVIRVNPQDFELAKAAVANLGETYGATNMRVVPDESIALASCCIETEAGKIYSEIPGRLKRIKEALLTEEDGC